MRSTLNFIILIFIISFLLNLFWEVSHSPLYDWKQPPLENTVDYYIPKILKATISDAFYVTLIFLIVTLINRNINWINKPTQKNLLIIIILGLVISISIEVKAKILNQWTYNDLMPQIFGIGLTPLIQLALTSLITLYIINSLCFVRKLKTAKVNSLYKKSLK